MKGKTDAEKMAGTLTELITAGDATICAFAVQEDSG